MTIKCEQCPTETTFTGETLADIKQQASSRGWWFSQVVNTSARCPNCTEADRKLAPEPKRPTNEQRVIELLSGTEQDKALCGTIMRLRDMALTMSTVPARTVADYEQAFSTATAYLQGARFIERDLKIEPGPMDENFTSIYEDGDYLTMVQNRDERLTVLRHRRRVRSLSLLGASLGVLAIVAIQWFF